MLYCFQFYFSFEALFTTEMKPLHKGLRAPRVPGAQPKPGAWTLSTCFCWKGNGKGVAGGQQEKGYRNKNHSLLIS